MNVHNYFEQADRLIQSHKYAECIEFLDSNSNTENDLKNEIYVLKGKCLEGLKRKNEAIEYYDKAIESRNVAAFNYKAFLLTNESESKQMFEQALELNKNPAYQQEQKHHENKK